MAHMNDLAQSPMNDKIPGIPLYNCRARGSRSGTSSPGQYKKVQTDQAHAHLFDRLVESIGHDPPRI